MRVLDHDGTPIVLSHRLTPLNTPPLEKGTPAILRLQEILIVGNSSEQVWHETGSCLILYDLFKVFDYRAVVIATIFIAHCLSCWQLKYSELTLDMFRMLQTLEREPQEDLSNQIYDASPAPGRPPYVSSQATGLLHRNCRKKFKYTSFLNFLSLYHQERNVWSTFNDFFGSSHIDLI